MIFLCLGFFMFDKLGESVEKMQEEKFNFELKKYHFKIKKVFVLDHIYSSDGMEVDKAKIDLLTNLPLPTYVKGATCFREHVEFYH